MLVSSRSSDSQGLRIHRITQAEVPYPSIEIELGTHRMPVEDIQIN